MKSKGIKVISIVSFYALVIGIFGLAISIQAQNPQTAGVTAVQHIHALYYVTPISSTGAVNASTTLTIPTPPAGLYNYVCKLAVNLSNDNTGTVVANTVTTSTNFNSFALKTSHVATASAGYDSPTYDFGSPATGCAKSTSPGTATTFVGSASGQTHSALTWYAVYYVAP